MNVGGRPYRTIWVGPDRASVEVIDQTRLPHAFEVVRLRSAEDAERAIRTMIVRGAPLIGATAAYGLWLAARADPAAAGMESAAARLQGARPTAVNLRWAVERMAAALRGRPVAELADRALAEAEAIASEDVRANMAIGEHGLAILTHLTAERGGKPLNIMTHCNAGWLAAVDWGTALAPVYSAKAAGLDVHVWVSETRPRNQGAALTAWELAQEGVPHTLVVDSACGHLMQRGLVDVCLVGADRVTSAGDVCNKVGTYLKALAARDSGVPFYAALPGSTIDWSLSEGQFVPIETRSADEVVTVTGWGHAGVQTAVSVAPAGTPAANPAFDVTPARLVTGLVTERGVCPATGAGLASLFGGSGGATSLVKGLARAAEAPSEEGALR